MKHTRIAAASLAIAVMTLAGCSKSEPAVDSLAMKSDSAAAANLALASADSAAKVQLADTANSSKTKAPAAKPKGKTTTTPTKPAPAPAPAPKAAAPTSGVIDAGSEITLAMNSKVCTNSNAVGDAVTAVTSGSVSGSNGVAIPAGATVNLTATTLKRSENVKDKVVMEFRVNSVVFGGHTYALDASVESADVRTFRDEPKSKDIQKVAIGAAAGAIAGKILGKSTKATVIGGAAGAAAGAATAAATANVSGCLDQGARMVVKLNSPLTLAITSP